MVENDKYQFATLMYALAENYTGTTNDRKTCGNK